MGKWRKLDGAPASEQRKQDPQPLRATPKSQAGHKRPHYRVSFEFTSVRAYRREKEFVTMAAAEEEVSRLKRHVERLLQRYREFPPRRFTSLYDPFKGYEDIEVSRLVGDPVYKIEPIKGT